MDMEYRQVGDDTHTSLYVNKGGKLEQYNPGTMYIYTENASDYGVMVELTEKALKEHGFVMRNADDAQKPFRGVMSLIVSVAKRDAIPLLC